MLYFRPRVLLLIGIVVWSGCGRSPSQATPKLENVFGQAQAIATVKNATSVKAFRLEPQRRSHHRESVDQYKITAGPVDVPDEVAEQLRTTLFDRDTYDWDRWSACLPDFGVRIQFILGGDQVDVLLCFQCNILAVYHNGKLVGGEEFTNAESALIAVAKQLFPDDEVIQQLKPSR